MSSLIKPSEWVPEGITRLEAAAEAAVKRVSNTLVIAGPGAGKTELLAQRACYLLKTGLCPAPRRILAISFKRDAARNLAERVKLRCGSSLSRRFDSMTFDSFSKGLLDRFLNALPKTFRPSEDYSIDVTIQKRMRPLLNSLPSRDNNLTMVQMLRIGEKTFYREQFLAHQIEVPSRTPSTDSEKAAQALWCRLVLGERPSQIDFPMIGRLAELILRQNPLILRALQSTYCFVFLDEFQDTTSIHYDLTTRAFRHSDVIVTAVGDGKQRIMGWAGALHGIFGRFASDFSPTIDSLALNHRSAPGLVHMQHHLIRALEPSAVLPEATEEKVDLEDKCQVLLFDNHRTEAEHLAEVIGRWIKTDHLSPRDICILARQQPEKYTHLITGSLRERGVKSRVENELQDLLSEPLTATLLAFLRIGLQGRSPEAWTIVRQRVFDTKGMDPSSLQACSTEKEISNFCKLIGVALFALTSENDEGVLSVLSEIMEFVGSEGFKVQHPQYSQGTFYQDTLSSCVRQLSASRKVTPNWLDAIDHFEGKDSVPIMTIHKCKGLEYHTVVFVGLEDSALWNFSKAQEEETCAFFVAFSRAISRVVFTFAQRRPRKEGESAELQSRETIGPLYSLLTKAGASEVRVNSR